MRGFWRKIRAKEEGRGRGGGGGLFAWYFHFCVHSLHTYVSY